MSGIQSHWTYSVVDAAGRSTVDGGVITHEDVARLVVIGTETLSLRGCWAAWRRRLPFHTNTAIIYILTRSIWKMLGPFTTARRLTPIHQMSLAVLSRAACASMSTTTPTTTTTTRDRGDRYGPMEWAQLICVYIYSDILLSFCITTLPINRKCCTFFGMTWQSRLFVQAQCSRWKPTCL